MNVIVLDSEAFEKLKQEFKGYVKQALAEFLREKNQAENSEQITIEDAMKLLPFKSKTTWQKLRDQGIIEISQSPGSRTILYSKKSIQKYLDSNRVKF